MFTSTRAPAALPRLLTLAGVTLAIACSPSAPPAAQDPTCATDAPAANLNFTLRNLDGAPVTLSDFKGQVVFLNFWATWCGPCRTEIPVLIELQQRYGSAGLAILGIVVRDDFASAQPYAERTGINYPVLDGTERDDLERAYRPPVLPSSFVIARNGSVCATHWGIPRPSPGESPADAVRRALEAAITPLL